MKKKIKYLLYLTKLFFIVVLIFYPLHSSLGMECVDGQQDGDSEDSLYRICMPDAGYNGRFIIWAHGFQDVTDDKGIPEDQLCFDGFCIPDIVVGLGFGFATNSYRKTGLAVKEGMADIIDLVKNLTDYSKDPECVTNDCEHIVPGPPEDVYIIGASEGGLITALLVEQNPDKIFHAGYALCGPIGDFPLQINYLGDARVTFEYFFPGKIPGYGIFNEIFYDGGVPENWNEYFDDEILPLFQRHPLKAKQWFKVAKLPYDPENYLATVLNSAKDVLRYSVVNMLDAIEELKGQPFDNRWKWYTGSYRDFRLNRKVKRIRADALAVIEMNNYYNTSGVLDNPLITMHTLHDQQVPYWHETLYNLKTFAMGSLLTDHVNIPVDRYGHCNFKLEEALGGFALMLLYAGDWEMFSALKKFQEAQPLEF